MAVITWPPYVILARTPLMFIEWPSNLLFQHATDRQQTDRAWNVGGRLNRLRLNRAKTSS